MSDWWSGRSEAHPLAVGTAIILFVFLWIRITGTRSLAGITVSSVVLCNCKLCVLSVQPDGHAASLLLFSTGRLARPSRLADPLCSQIFDWILSVALGSTVSRIITQPDLDFTRGVLACVVILAIDWLASFLCAVVPGAERVIKHDAALLVFRGHILDEELRRNRLHVSGVHQAMRQKGVASLEEIEAVVLEGNGSLSTILRTPGVEARFPEAMKTVPTYARMRREWETKHGRTAAAENAV